MMTGQRFTFVVTHVFCRDQSSPRGEILGESKGRWADSLDDWRHEAAFVSAIILYHCDFVLGSASLGHYSVCAMGWVFGDCAFGVPGALGSSVHNL